jgi:Asp-tRNA(Asn)/Glu-tRNA(Gln) amidotransferase A subunit family amidase
VGLCRTYQWEQAKPETKALFETAGHTLSAAGARVKEITLPAEFAALAQAQTEIMAYEAAQSLVFEFNTHGDKLSPKLRELIAMGRALSPQQHDNNLQLAQRCRRQLADLFLDLDVLIAPSTTAEAPEGLVATGDPVFNRIWTVLGTPCIHLPFAQGPRGLPLGLQVIGAGAGDRAMLAAADWIHSALLNRSR